MSAVLQRPIVVVTVLVLVLQAILDQPATRALMGPLVILAEHAHLFLLMDHGLVVAVLVVTLIQTLKPAAVWPMEVMPVV